MVITIFVESMLIALFSWSNFPLFIIVSSSHCKSVFLSIIPLVHVRVIVRAWSCWRFTSVHYYYGCRCFPGHGPSRNPLVLTFNTLLNRQTERHTLDELAFLSHLLCPKICIEGFSPPMDRCQVTDIDNAGSFWQTCYQLGGHSVENECVHVSLKMCILATARCV